MEGHYETHDKELLAIIEAFRKWRHYLAGGETPVEVLSDHNNLKYFMTTKSLTARQARWAETLSGFDFEIAYRPGKKNPADGLSRRPDYQFKVDTASLMLPTLQRKLSRAWLEPKPARVRVAVLTRSQTDGALNISGEMHESSKALREGSEASSESDRDSRYTHAPIPYDEREQRIKALEHRLEFLLP